MNIRLVAYRKATSTSTSDSAYNLDLQEAPNVSLNFQFSDIKKPETRKGSYSQTFKLPFTDNNNEFFQNWYGVNLITLVFSTRKSFDAILYVGTVPQFEGQLQLKSVYKKAEYYEVVLMSNTATLFSSIGESKLKDVFKNDDGSYSADLNHKHKYTDETNNTLYDSWNATLENIAGTIIKDTSITTPVSKILYPFTVLSENFYFDANVYQYLNMNQANTLALSNDIGITPAYQKTAHFSQFRPSIQIKTLLKLIIAKSGFSYTSNFIDGDYFGGLFMTTCNHLETGAIPTTNLNTAPSGLFSVQEANLWGTETIVAYTNNDFQIEVPADLNTPNTSCTVPIDTDGAWTTSGNFKNSLIRIDSDLLEITIKFKPELENLAPYYNSNSNTLNLTLASYGVDENGDTDFNDTGWDTNFNIYMSPLGSINVSTALVSITVPVFWFPVGSRMRFYVEGQVSRKVQTSSSFFRLGAFNSDEWCGDARSSITGTWVGYSVDNSYNGEVDIPACIDPSIKQKDFLKDILQRFNLVVSTSPEDDTNLIIEPYNDFIAGGDIKHWTDKLDTSKEIIVKDTTNIQQKEITLTDKEDTDLYNKSIKERQPDINVYGKLNITNNNDFAKGELKNDSIFSPFINSQVFANDQEDFSTFLPNMTVQYERSYEMKDGIAEYKLGVTKPKLFYYCGVPVDVLGTDGLALPDGYYLHRTKYTVPPLGDGLELIAMKFTLYPICSPFDIIPSGTDNTYTLTENNLSLYWNASPPLFGNLSVFNYTGNYGNWFNGSLYGKYWKPYLDSIYSSSARIMECYLNLNSVDIFNFKFSDEIFIEDTYWRILNISNYQVGGQASTKVTLIKSIDSFETCQDCDYVVGSINGNNLYADLFYLWCPEGTPDCVPDIVSVPALGAFTTPECCECNGGIVMENYTVNANIGLYPCYANASSLPIVLKSIFSNNSILNTNQVKGLINGILAGRNNPLIRGVNTTKYSQHIIPKYGNDIIIKYNNEIRNEPSINGESHRFILSGSTIKNTRSYAYNQGNKVGIPLKIPNNTNINIRVKGISTVIGGTSATYPLGSTEAFAYYTAFKTQKGVVTQLGTIGGTVEFSLKEAGASSVCSLYIDITNSILNFGLDDSQTDTDRVWELSVDMDVNIIKNMTIEYNANFALFQNGDIIKFQNGDYLLWN